MILKDWFPWKICTRIACFSSMIIYEVRADYSFCATSVAQ
jgi:hypothetical protein